jgi:hypothetical protein
MKEILPIVNIQIFHQTGEIEKSRRRDGVVEEI